MVEAVRPLSVTAWRRQKLTRGVAAGMPCWMKRCAILIACASGPALGQLPADPTPSNLTFRLEYATRDADAHHDCPSPRGDDYAADFRKRYGQRIEHLKQVHVARSGPDPDFIILTDCRGFTGSMVERDAQHRKAMKRFEPTLRALEQEFGGY